MPITLDATPGSATANTYAIVADADTYNAQRPFTTAWAGTADQKAAALIQAAMILDASFPWTGVATLIDVQALSWPRNGMLNKNGGVIDSMTIPAQLKNAQSELARCLLAADLAASNDAQVQGLKGLTAGPVSLQFALPGEMSSTLALRDADILMRTPQFLWMSKVMPMSVVMLIPQSWWNIPTVTQRIYLSTER